MDKDDRYAIDRYAGEDKWRGNYVRAEWAGKVLDPKVFPQIIEAVKTKDEAMFLKICWENMPDVPEGKRKNLIRDMWAATMASQALGDQYKSCW